ncbi:hypothetical protein N9026_00230 [bacterium]|nr:hypothetical protein [bacterium]
MNEEKIDNMSRAKGVSLKHSLPDLNAPRYTPGPLPILYSARVRLNEDQRNTLKAAWRQHQNVHLATIPPPSSTPGSTVRTETYYKAPDLPGLSALIVSDLLGTRESIAITTVLNISAALKVDVITKEQMQEAFDGYWSYITAEAQRIYA